MKRMRKREKGKILKFARKVNGDLMGCFVDVFNREPNEDDVIEVVDTDLFHIMHSSGIIFAFVTEMGVVHSLADMGYEEPPTWDEERSVVVR